MYQIEAINAYEKALKEGQKECRECAQKGLEMHPIVLDEILGLDGAENSVFVGLVEVPAKRIVGTKTAGRITAFSPSFRPLLGTETEFARKWVKLCADNLGDEGIRDPIECFEYLGNFYVQEGNKRVSVLRHFGAYKIMANVKRIPPMLEDGPRLKAYQEFLEFYKLTGMYDIQFTTPGNYAKLLEKIGVPADWVWTQEDRQYFRASYHYFMEGMASVGGNAALLQPEDALMMWLNEHPFKDLRELTATELKKTILAMWPNLLAVAVSEPVVKMEPPEEKKKRLSLFKSNDHLNVAFVHKLTEETSYWTRAHENGRKHLEQVMGNAVTTRSYDGADTPELAAERIKQAVDDGAEVVFTTTPQLIGPCMKASLKYPKVQFLNCSVQQPYATVRTYYGRVFEGKFITGAIAGAMCKNNLVGYVGAYPIYGVPASINAFALGAQMTNPDAKVILKWSCVKNNPTKDFFEEGVRVISNRDNPVEDKLVHEFGTYMSDDDGNLTPLGSPVWVWGQFYENMVRSIMNGSWAGNKNGQIINHWWGLNSGVIDVNLPDDLPEGIRILAEMLKEGIRNGTLDPFKRKIIDQQGNVRNDGTKTFEPMELLQMDWLCENVIGEFPKYEDVLPMSRPMVDLLGIYSSTEEAGVL